VVTFYPHPAVVLRGLQGPFYLTSSEEKADLLSELGIDVLINMPFNRDLANLQAEDFMRLLDEHLDMAQVWVGSGFALGRNRAGTLPILREIGTKLGYTLYEIPLIAQADGKASSSHIRRLLSHGDVRAAALQLGRYYSISGEVVHGDARGRTIGMRTANIQTEPERLLPEIGVYATFAWVKDERFASVTNIGLRPTFEDQPVQARIETHIMGLDADLYGSSLRLEFVERLRGEKQFANAEELIRQIHGDIQSAEEIFQNDPTSQSVSAGSKKTQP
jgi:riboflavin kinase / FMN adenylyltransferase